MKRRDVRVTKSNEEDHGQVHPVQEKLVTVTRQDLTAGYQLCQTGHAIADFADELPQFFKSWKDNSNYLISLAAKDEISLNKIYEKLNKRGAPIIAFREPDLDNQLTALCFYGLPHYRKVVSNLPLALKNIDGTGT